MEETLAIDVQQTQLVTKSKVLFEIAGQFFQLGFTSRADRDRPPS